MQGFLERLQAHRSDMTASERQIAAYLETGYPHAGLEPAAAVAEKVKVSAATVVRFIAKLGYAGYGDFQGELRAQVQTRLTSPLDRLVETSDGRAALSDGMASDTGGDIATASFRAAQAALIATYERLDRHQVGLVSSRLSNCKGHIWVVGEKKARSIALYLYAQLNACLERVRLFSPDASFEADTLLDVTARDVVVTVDVRRYVAKSVEASRWCQAQGAALIVLADSPRSPLFATADHRLLAATGTARVFDNYAGLMLLADLITNTVIAQNPERAQQRLERGEEAWKAFHTFS